MGRGTGFHLAVGLGDAIVAAQDNFCWSLEPTLADRRADTSPILPQTKSASPMLLAPLPEVVLLFRICHGMGTIRRTIGSSSPKERERESLHCVFDCIPGSVEIMDFYNRPRYQILDHLCTTFLAGVVLLTFWNRVASALLHLQRRIRVIRKQYKAYQPQP